MELLGDGLIEWKKFENYQFCPHSAHLDGLIKQNKIPIYAGAAKTMWQKNQFKKLFGINKDSRRVGPDLIHIEDIEPSELSNHLANKSALAFGNTLKNRWNRLFNDKNAKYHDREVVWNYANEWWNIENRLVNIGINYYKYVEEYGAPILDHMDKEMAFSHAGKKYNARFDEIREGMLLTRHKGSDISQKKLDNDPLITLAVLAYCTLAHDVEGLRIKWGIDKERAENWGGNDMYIDPDVVVQYHHLGSEKMEKSDEDQDLKMGKIKETRRSDEDLTELLFRIDEIQEEMRISKETGEYIPNLKNCSTCSYNVLEKTNKRVCTATVSPDYLKSMRELEKDMYKEKELKKKLKLRNKDRLDKQMEMKFV